MSAHFLDVLQGLTTLKILGRSRDQAGTIAAVSQQFAATTLGVLRVAFLSAFALEMIATISTAIVAVQVGLRLLYGQVEFEQAFFVLVLAPDFYLPLRLLGTRFHAGMAGTAAAARIFEVLEERPHPRPHPKPLSSGRGERPHPRPLSYRRGEIVFEDVHYAYDGGRRALDGVSFAIEAGQHVALVGPSGAGKSTVFNLLLRFIEPDRGQITCGGVPLCDIGLEEWREQMAWVPQDPYLFADTVAANIRLARPAASMEDVIRAAEKAYADEFIRALPQGYDTPIGERGARLSGGQRQRIALARAFLKDAPLLLLDEATANLDGENAALVQDAVDTLMRGRTTLTITHRLNTAACADQIIVLANGRVAERGAHAGLVRQEGIYHRLVAAGRMEGVQ
jgi:thiol reductant ABC exporter CydD subunit